MHGFGMGEVAQQLTGPSAAQVAPAEGRVMVEHGGAPALARGADRGAVASAEQSQAAIAEDEPAMAVDSMRGEQLAPLQRGRELGDAATLDAEQCEQVVGPDPGPVADPLEAALLRRREPGGQQPVRFLALVRRERTRRQRTPRSGFNRALSPGTGVIQRLARLSLRETLNYACPYICYRSRKTLELSAPIRFANRWYHPDTST